jgi:hypothetical protein
MGIGFQHELLLSGEFLALWIAPVPQAQNET